MISYIRTVDARRALGDTGAWAAPGRARWGVPPRPSQIAHVIALARGQWGGPVSDGGGSHGGWVAPECQAAPARREGKIGGSKIT